MRECMQGQARPLSAAHMNPSAVRTENLRPLTAWEPPSRSTTPGPCMSAWTGSVRCAPGPFQIQAITLPDPLTGREVLGRGWTGQRRRWFFTAR